MLKYIIKRILMMPIILLCSTFIIFMFINLTPVDPAYQLLPSGFNDEQLNDLHEELGLDKPIVVQYANWLWDALHGDFGTSYATRGDVWDEVAFRIPITIELSFITTALVLVIGMPLGVICAVKQYSIFDTIINVTSKLLGAFPRFWLAIILMLIFCNKLNLLPSYGTESWKSWILPVTTLALPNISNYIRQARSATLDCIRQDYVRTARSKGKKEKDIILKDTLRNALLPMVTMTGTQFAMLLGNTVVIEKVFSIPGIGLEVIDAINSKDIPVVMFCTMIISAIFIFVTLLIDISYVFIDPRIKTLFLKSKTSNRRKRFLNVE